MSAHWKLRGLQDGICTNCGCAIQKYRILRNAKCTPCYEAYQKAHSSERAKKSYHKYRDSNRESRNRKHHEWVKANPDKVREHAKRHYWSNPEHRLRVIARTRIRHALNGKRRRVPLETMLGCSISELRAYLENKFLPGMTWDNWSYHGWHIDHIQPLASFDLSDPKQFAIACHHTNLQPLWAMDNFKKQAKTTIQSSS